MKIWDKAKALNNRFIHFKVMCDVKQWLLWGSQNNIHENVLTLIATKGHYLNGGLEAMTENANIASTGIKEDDVITCTPRTWEYVSDLMHAGISKASMDYIIPGTVGSVAAMALKTTLEELGDLPPIEELFKAGDDELRRILPTKGSGMFNLCYSLPKFCTDAKSFIKAFHILNVFVSIKDGLSRSEVQALAAELLSKKLNSEASMEFATKVTDTEEFAILMQHAQQFANLATMETK